MLTRSKYKKIHRRLRLITGSKMVGTHGHLSDLVKEYNVSIGFLRDIRELRRTPKRLIYGKYTSEYIENQNQANAWESYGERKVRA